MIKKIIAMMFGLCVASVAGAVNDPDSTGRTVKYLDVMNGAILSYYTPDSACFQFSPSAPQPQSPITCVALAGGGAFEPLPLTSVGEIVVAANASYSQLTLNMQPVADYTLFSVTGGNPVLILSAQVKVTIESSMLTDPNLINPRTGQPFNGKIETTYQWLYDRRYEDPNRVFAVATKMPFETTILTRKSLTALGISSTRAALIFARPITVKVALTGNLMGSGRANFFMGGRLFGD